MILHRTLFRNGSGSTLTVHVEPWGEQHRVGPGSAIEVVFYGPRQDKPEVVTSGSELTVYGWTGTTVFVLRDNMCVAQPSLELILRGLCESAGIEWSLATEPEMLDYAQAMLDSAPFWDGEGREAALFAIGKVSQDVCRQTSESVAVEFCNRLLHSRGIFLPALTEANAGFVKALKKGDAVSYITSVESAAIKSLID